MKNRSRRKRIFLTFVISLIVIACLVLTIFLYSIKKPAKDDSNVIRLGYIKQAAELPLYVALENGYFKEQGLTVELVPLGYKEEMDALIRGDIDVIPATSMSLPFGVEGQEPGLIKIFQPGGIPAEDSEVIEAIITLNDSGIYNLGDLNGRKVGVSAGATDMFVMKTILKKNGLDVPEDVNVMEMKKEHLAIALNAGQVDAIYMTQPDLAMLMSKINGRYIVKNPRAKYIVAPFWSGAGVVISDYIGKNQQKFIRYLDATDKAIDYAEKNPMEAKRILASYTPLDENLTSEVGLYFKAKSTDKIDLTKIQEIADIFYTLGTLNTKINVAEMFYSREKN